MILVYLLLFVVSFVIFLLAAFGMPTRRVYLTALGLAVVVLVWVLQTIQRFQNI